MKKDKKILLLIDSFALIYRAYYAYPKSLTTAKGETVNAVYGFANLMVEVLKKFKPTNVIAVFDPQTPIIRQQEFTAYKANRKPMDEELQTQIPRVRELIEAFGIPVLSVDGYEADDVIGTIDKKHSGEWAETIIVTGDQDIFQLVDEDTTVYLAGSQFSKSKLYTPADVKEKLGIGPEHITDYKSLRGDPSDNIPGVAGIGEKTAVELIKEFGTLDSIYENIEKIKGKTQEKLMESYEIAQKSKQLATIERDVPISFDFKESLFTTLDLQKITNILAEFEFKSLVKKVEELGKIYGAEQTMSLFSQPDANEQTTKLADIKPLKDYKIDEETLYLFPTFKNIEKNPLQWELSQIFILQKDVAFVIDSDKIAEFTASLKNKKVITIELKKWLHSLENMKISYIGIDFYDVLAAGFVVAGGQIKYDFETFSRFFTGKTSLDPEAALHAIQSSYEKINESFEEFPKMKAVAIAEMQLTPLVKDMERAGVILNLEQIQKDKEKFLTKKDQLVKAIYESAGHEFNINSPKQVADILFNEKKLTSPKKTKGGAQSTGEEVLMRLLGTDPIIKYILEYREVDKILSTYLTPLPGFVSQDGRIHALFDQFGAVSGRFSSKNPNMQNIPGVDIFGINIRSSFQSDKNKIFVAFDYSQQELRILAALSGEEVMIDSFNTGKDIHKITAAELFGKTPEEVTKEERSIGKTINFSIVYGISGFGLSERMQIDRSIADEFISKYNNKYKKIKEYFAKKKISVFALGYAESISGRRRILDKTKINNHFARMAAERELLNFEIQATAADIMKRAMVEVKNFISKYPTKLIAQIHDELLFEYDLGENKNIQDLQADADFKKFVVDVKHAMTEFLNIGVKYDVDVKVGAKWGEMEEVNI